MLSFDVYTTSSASTLYSSQFFTNLSFQDASVLLLHTALPDGLLLCWSFLSTQPADVDDDWAHYVALSEEIPLQADLLPVMSKLNEGYDAGNRFVRFTLKSTQYGEYTLVFHFAKLRLFTSINNHREAISLSRDLLHRIESSTAFPDDIVEHFRHACITGVIHGFLGSDYPMWKLGTLLDENYVDEEVINSLAELLYLRQAANAFGEPTFLFLPTFFFNNVTHHEGDICGPNVQAFRDRLNALPYTIRGFAFLACLNRHYTGYFYDRTCLMFADTLSNGAAGIAHIALKATQQLIEGINLPQTAAIVEGGVSLQGPGSGSCGIGALAWIEKQVNSSTPAWTNETSGAHRDRALSDLLLYNMVSESTLMNELGDWLTPCLTRPAPQSGPPSYDTGFDIEYKDYNMFAPTDLSQLYVYRHM
ncbi:hypothetical protein BT96DRAFT_985351 [Gymnopus androsaceus JB14]|uniref:Uncharacterized protein n=1 Tax=Gymnopus androsaceus JB14 TaxID=1447944 RepID=A0A6A4IJ54_9AGAR|nr:hypothetical protein BT96DRAFT_985351 [Gymnopus androsaceus JB14]